MPAVRWIISSQGGPRCWRVCGCGPPPVKACPKGRSHRKKANLECSEPRLVRFGAVASHVAVSLLRKHSDLWLRRWFLYPPTLCVGAFSPAAKHILGKGTGRIPRQVPEG